MRPSSANQDLPVPTAGVRIEQVDLSYGDNHVLKSIDLDIHPGEFFAFLGPSGCGKTTLLRLIAGFNRADRGRVLVGNEDISDLPPWKRDIGMVFQSYALWPHMTVARNVAFGLEEKRVPRAEIGPRVAAALQMVGLTGLDQRRPGQLSGGQQQRVALARTIAVEPKLLLLDEPLSNLDAKLRVQVRRELRDLQQRLGLTTIFVTHDQEEANTVCDRIAVMNHGVIQQVGTPKDLYERPANLFVANFLGTANILEGRLAGDGASLFFEAPGGLRLPVPSDQNVDARARAVFRPQDAAIVNTAGTPAGTAPVTAQVMGTVSWREFLGASVRYGVRAGTSDIVVDRPFHAGDTLYGVGTAVTVAIATQSVRWLSD
jgi:iron(III) transport system ATP-binding protein